MQFVFWHCFSCARGCGCHEYHANQRCESLFDARFARAERLPSSEPRSHSAAGDHGAAGVSDAQAQGKVRIGAARLQPRIVLPFCAAAAAVVVLVTLVVFFCLCLCRRRSSPASTPTAAASSTPARSPSWSWQAQSRSTFAAPRTTSPFPSACRPTFPLRSPSAM